MAIYLSCADTAKLVRAALKEAFPGFKFSVRSKVYSGGASITVEYFDGPLSSDVQSIVRRFEGAYFDGMTDYKGIKYNAIDGKEVSFGANFIFVRRNLSAEFLAEVAAGVVKYYQFEVDYEIVPSIYGAWIKIDSNKNYQKRADCNFTDLVMRAASEKSLLAPQVSKVANSVQSLGDDGYGYGSVGRIAA